MKHRSLFVTIVLVVVMMLFATTATAVLASREPMPNHAPVCYKVPYYIPGTYELQCYDVGKDIIDVSVKTAAEYEIFWDNEKVNLRVFSPLPKGDELLALWLVRDKAGDEASGTLP